MSASWVVALPRNLKVDAPPRLDGHLYSTLTGGESRPGDVQIVARVINADLTSHLEIAPPRCTAHPNPRYPRHDTAENARGRGVVSWIREGEIVAAFALTAVGGENLDRRAVKDGEIQSDASFIVVRESPAK